MLPDAFIFGSAMINQRGHGKMNRCGGAETYQLQE